MRLTSTDEQDVAGDPTNDVQIRRQFNLLGRNFGFVFVFVLSAALTALGLTYVFAEKYESYTAISYRVQEVTRFKSLQNEAIGSPVPQAPFKVIGQTLKEVLGSDAILRDAVKALHLDEPHPSVYTGPWYRVAYLRAKDWLVETGRDAVMLLKYGRILEQDPTAAAIEELRRNVSLTNRDSYVFLLQVLDRQPDRAAKIADHLAQVLAIWLLELDREPGRSRQGQLRALLDDKKAQMVQRRKEIQSLLADSHVASIQVETERLTESLSALKLEQVRLSSEIARGRTRQVTTDAKLAVKRRILESAAGPVEATEYVQPDDFRKLASQRLFDEIELASLTAKLGSLEASIETLRTRLQSLPEIQGRLDTLRSALATVEREYALLNDGYQEAAVRASSPVSEVRVLHPAVVPTAPVAPIKIYHVLLAAGLGLVVAVALVYVLDFLGIELLFAARSGVERHLPAGREQPVAAEPADATPREGGEHA